MISRPHSYLYVVLLMYIYIYNADLCLHLDLTYLICTWDDHSHSGFHELRWEEKGICILADVYFKAYVWPRDWRQVSNSEVLQNLGSKF